MPHDNDAIRAARERVRPRRSDQMLTFNVRTDLGETGWLAFPPALYDALMNAALTDHVTAGAPVTRVGERIKAVDADTLRVCWRKGTITAEDSGTVTIRWDDGDVSDEKSADLGVTWVYAPCHPAPLADEPECPGHNPAGGAGAEEPDEPDFCDGSCQIPVRVIVRPIPGGWGAFRADDRTRKVADAVLYDDLEQRLERLPMPVHIEEVCYAHNENEEDS